jgi:hypothetical protein
VQRESTVVIPVGEVGGDLRGERAVAHGGTQGASADPPLYGAGRGCIEIGGGMEAQRAVRIEAEHAVGDAAVQVGVGIERRAKALHERHSAAA